MNGRQADAIEIENDTEDFTLQGDEDVVTDPISRERIRFPVTASDGYTYELYSLCQWFKSGKLTSPMSGLPITGVVYNHQLKAMLDRKYGSNQERFAEEHYINEEGKVDIKPFLEFLTTQLVVKEIEKPQFWNVRRSQRHYNHEQEEWKQSAAISIAYGFMAYGTCWLYNNVAVSDDNAESSHCLSLLISMSITLTELTIRKVSNNQSGTIHLISQLPNTITTIAKGLGHGFTFFANQAASHLPVFSSQPLEIVDLTNDSDQAYQEEISYRR